MTLGAADKEVQMRRKGFTLIELLVVIAIIAVIAPILFPVFAQAREKARQATCLSNHKQIGMAFGMYAQDYDETFVPVYVEEHPPQRLWPGLLQPYLRNSNVYREPSNWARTPYEARDHPANMQANVERNGYEGLVIGTGQNACVPRHGF